MSTTTELFSGFDKRITASEDEWTGAVQRLLTCKAALAAHYYGTASTDGCLTVIGSAAKGTSMAAMSDVDGVFHMPAGTFHRFDSYAGNGQSALLQEVRGVLARRYPRTRIRGDGPTVVVEFTSGPNVEIVPGVLFSDGASSFHARCRVPVTRDGGSWEDSDYGAEYDNCLTADTATDGQYTRLIRYMKAWRSACGASIKSVVLELMAAHFMRTWPRQQTTHLYDDWLVRDFLTHMIDNYVSTYSLPTGKQIDTGFGWIAHVKVAQEDATTACDYGISSRHYVPYWRKVFGNDFGV